MESAIAGTLETFRNNLQTALDRAKATAGQVGSASAGDGGGVDHEGGLRVVRVTRSGIGCEVRDGCKVFSFVGVSFFFVGVRGFVVSL